MQSTLVKHNKFFKAGHATSFDTAKKYAVSCDADSSEYAEAIDPGFITTGDFSFTMSFRYNYGRGATGPFFVTNGFTARMSLSNGTIRIAIADGTGNAARIDTNNDLGDGDWHTIVISCDRDGDMDYYEDYDGIGGGYTESVDISSVTASLEDAGSNDNWYFGFDGSTRYAGIDIDQIGFYSLVLSSVNAITLYGNLKLGLELYPNPTLPTPICYWKCNEGTGVSVANDGSESDELVLRNTPTWITDGMI